MAEWWQVLVIPLPSCNRDSGTIQHHTITDTGTTQYKYDIPSQPAAVHSSAQRTAATHTQPSCRSLSHGHTTTTTNTYNPSINTPTSTLNCQHRHQHT